MTVYSRSVWDQIKNRPVQDIAKALVRDGWSRDEKPGAIHTYRHPCGRRVNLHIHPQGEKGRGVLKDILEAIGWDESDLVRLKLVKKSKSKRPQKE